MNYFAWWPTISETPGKLDEKYWENTKTPKINFDWWGLYNTWVKENKVWSENVNENQEKIDLKKIKEKPWYPIIERFIETSWIKLSNQDLYLIFEWIWDKHDWQILIDQLKESLEHKTINNKEYLLNYLNIAKKLNKEKKEIWTDKEIDLPKVFNKYDFLNNKNDEIVTIIANNYLVLPDLNWESNEQKDIKTALKLSVNKIIDWKQFPRNENFDLAMKDINNINWSIEEKFYALKYINSLVQTSGWSKWWKNKKDFKQIKERHKLTKKEYLDFKIEQVEQLLVKSKNETEKLKYELELESLNENLNDDDFKWEVFQWWEIDKSKENIESEQQI